MLWLDVDCKAQLGSLVTFDVMLLAKLTVTFPVNPKAAQLNIVHSPPDQTVQVQALAEQTVFCSWARHYSLSASVHQLCINGIGKLMLVVTL